MVIVRGRFRPRKRHERRLSSAAWMEMAERLRIFPFVVLGLVAATALAGAVGAIIGLFTLRFRGLYLALATFASTPGRFCA